MAVVQRHQDTTFFAHCYRILYNKVILEEKIKWFREEPNLPLHDLFNEKFEDQALTDKLGEASDFVSKFATSFKDSFNMDAFKQYSSMSIDLFLAFMEELKPMNFTLILSNYVAAKSWTEKQAIILCLLELYGDFWTEFNISKAIILEALMACLDFVLTKCWSSARDFLGLPEEELYEDQSIQVSENGFLKKIFSFVGYENVTMDEETGFIATVIMMLFAIVTGGTLSSFSNISVDKIIKRVQKFSSSVKSIHNLFEYLPKVWDQCLSTLGSTLGFEYQSKDEEITKFCERLVIFKNRILDYQETIRQKPWLIIQQPEILSDIESSFKDLDKLYLELMKIKQNMSATKHVFDEVKDVVKKLRDYVSNIKHSTCSKQEPFILFIAGAPGIGKSRMVSGLINAVAKKCNFPATSYTRNAGVKHWDDYVNQSFVIFDDFGAVKDDLDHAEIMKFKNPNKTILPMADISDKGRQFSSVGAILCSNDKDMSSSAVVKCSQALVRRMEIKIFAIDPNMSEFVDKHNMSPGDFEKSTRQTAMIEDLDGNLVPYFDHENFEHLQFFLSPHYLAAEKTEREVSFQEIVDLCSNYYYTYKDAFERSIVAPTLSAYETSLEELQMEVGSMKVTYNANPTVVSPEISETESIGACSSTSSNSRRRKQALPEFVKSMYKTEADQIVAQAAYKKLDHQLAAGKIDPEQYAEDRANLTILGETAIRAVQEKKQFVEHYMKKFKVNQTAAEREWKRRYVYEEQALEQPFIQVDRGVGTIILLSGDPGTGKSTMQTILQQRFPQHSFIHGAELNSELIPPGVLFVEDPTISAQSFSTFEQLVCRVYDNCSPVTAIVASVNPEILKSYFNNLESYSRFSRRCIWVNFKFNVKETKLFKKDIMWTPQEVTTETYDNAVSLTCSQLRPGRLGTPEICNFILDKLRSTSVVTLPVSVAVPYVSDQQIDPDFIIEFEETLEEGFKKFYDDTSKMVPAILSGKVKLVKGSIVEGISIARSFEFSGVNGDRIIWPGCVDDFIILANNTAMRCATRFSVLLVAADGQIMIMPQTQHPNRVLMFRVVNNFVVNDSCTAVALGDDLLELNPPSREIYLTTVGAMFNTAMDVTENLAKEVGQEVTVKAILKDFPYLSYITGVLMFTLKLVLAGCSMFELLGAAKKRFLTCDYQEETRKRGKKRAYALSNFAASARSYDDFTPIVNKYATTAHKMRVMDCLDFCADYWKGQGHDVEREDITPQDLDNFMEKVDWDIWRARVSRRQWNESREDRVVQAPPKPVLLDVPFTLEKNESREDRVIQAPPKPVMLDIPFALENKEKERERLIGRGIPYLLEKIDPPQKAKNQKTYPKMTEEALYDPSIRDMITLAESSTVEICDKTGLRLCYGVMIQHKLGVTVSHIYPRTEELYVRTYKTVVPTMFPIKVEKCLPRRDILIFSVKSKSFPSYKSILHHLPIKNSEMEQLCKNRNAVMCISEKSTSTKLVQHIKLSGVQQITTTTGEKDGFSYVNMNNHLIGAKSEVPINTQPGDCGALIIMNDPSVKTKFLGLHNAGNDFRAHASFLYQEYFTELMDTESMVPQSLKPIINPHHLIDLKELSHESLLGMPIVGEGEVKVMRPQKTHLHNSPLALPGPCQYQPSIMSSYDYRNVNGIEPYYASVGKWNHPQPQLDEALLDKCVSDLGYWYAMEIRNSQIETKVLTKTEAINSGKNYAVMPINRKSAAGYPWFKYGNKETFLVNKGNLQEAYYGIDLRSKKGQLLNASIDFIIETCRTPGHYVKIPFSGWLKDEPLKMKKINEVNSRSFAGAPFDFTIAYRMFFATIQGAIHSVRHKMPVQIGINAASMEWDFLVRRLLECSPTGFDLDFKGFDASVPSAIQKRVVEIHNQIARINDPDWNIEHDIIRRGLHNAFVKPLIACPVQEKVYMLSAPGGQPSGHPGTADDNSLIHLIYLYYAWCKIWIAQGKPEMATILQFSDKVKSIIYGDDGVYMVSPVVQEVFNFVSVESVMRSMGIECTPASKGSVVQPIIKLTECEFLKREFVRHGAYWFAPLKDASFEKMLGYCLGPAHTWNEKQPPYCERPADLIATADSCMYEAAIKGRDFFEKMRAHCHKALIDINVSWFPPQYEDVVHFLELPLPL